MSLYSINDTRLNQVDPQPYATQDGNGWYMVSIPLTALQAANATISRAQVQDDSGAAQPLLHIDELGFLGDPAQPPPPPPPPPAPPPPASGTYFIYDDSLHWANWSWKTTVNPNAASPIYAGTRSMSVAYTAAWAGLSLHTSNFSTAPYSSLSFAIHPAGQTLPTIAVSLYSASDTVLNQVDPRGFATAAGNGWYLVSIPLSALNGANTTITRVQLQDDSGSAQPAFYIDNLGFAP